MVLSSFADNPVTDTESISVIVNMDNPVTKLTRDEVKLYYLRKIKKRWPELNKNIRPADRKKPCAERNTFYSAVLDMNADDVEHYFVNKQIQNAERPQDKFNTEEEMIDFVADEPGAIGYIKTSSITDKVRARVKVVFTY